MGDNLEQLIDDNLWADIDEILAIEDEILVEMKLVVGAFEKIGHDLQEGVSHLADVGVGVELLKKGLIDLVGGNEK